MTEGTIDRVFSVSALLQNHLCKESFKSFTIISAENKTDARIYGTICASHEKGNRVKVLEATLRPHVRSKPGEKPYDSKGKEAYCKP